MKWIAIIATIGVGAILVFAFTAPPFLLPDVLYSVIYGWRYPKEWHCGSSRITDIGPRAARHRYVVDAGAIDLNTEGASTFTLCQVPNEVSNLFLVVSWDDEPIHVGGFSPWRNDDDLVDTNVEIRVSDSNGVNISSHSGRLGTDWIWSGPFGSNRKEVWLYGSGTSVEFQPNQTYVVNLSVENPASGTPRVRLLGAGGGWK